LKKEALRQHQMAGMTEEQRKQAERAHEEEIRKHKQHPDINHPGGKEQLEEVGFGMSLQLRISADPVCPRWS
jgi:hypothetical protein